MADSSYPCGEIENVIQPKRFVSDRARFIPGELKSRFVRRVGAFTFSDSVCTIHIVLSGALIHHAVRLYCLSAL